MNNKQHIYDSHHGDFYMGNTENDDTYCEICGDSDWYIGYFTQEEFAQYLITQELRNYELWEETPTEEDLKQINKDANEISEDVFKWSK